MTWFVIRGWIENAVARTSTFITGLCSLRLDLRTGYQSTIETRLVYSHGGEIGHPCYVQHAEIEDIEAFSIFCFRSHEKDSFCWSLLAEIWCSDFSVCTWKKKNEKDSQKSSCL